MRAAIEKYLSEREPALAQASIRSERYHLDRFFGFCLSSGLSLSGLNSDHLRRYRQSLENYAEHSRAKAMWVAKNFCVWAHREGLVFLDLGSFRLRIPREKLPSIPTVTQVRKLLELPDPATREGRRDRLILELFYVLGLRLGEVHGLDREHLDLAGRTVRIQGKGDHQRLLPLSPKLLATCTEYLEKTRPAFPQGDTQPALFLTYLGKRMAAISIEVMVRKMGRRIGLKTYPHQLRHACATHLAEAGVEYRYLQELLGHRFLSSTQRYARLTPRELRREFFRCHPRAHHPKEVHHD